MSKENIAAGAFSQATDLKKRIFFTIFILIIYRVGTYVPLAGIDPVALKEIMATSQKGLLGMFNMFSGGAVTRMAIFALGIMPYISSSIIVQLLTGVSDYFKRLKEQGEIGRKKITQLTRYGTVLIACLQGYGVSVGLENAGSMVINPGLYFKITTTITLVAGTTFLMWLGEQITLRGVGNGISLIIFSGIVAEIPRALASTFELGRTGALSALMIVGIFVLVILTVLFIVFVERAMRKILINYPKRQVGNKIYGGESSHLPLKINTAGVIPAIFASALLLLPVTLTNFGLSESEIFLDISSMFTQGQPLYMLLYASGIIFFSFFYTSIVFNPKETAENLRKYGGYIPGIRPGDRSAEYIETILIRLTTIGSMYLTFVCLMPEFLISKYPIPFYLGGTSILIVVVGNGYCHNSNKINEFSIWVINQKDKIWKIISFMNSIIFGPPGAGKGTQADFIVNKFDLHQLSTGQVLRNEIKNKTELGSKISSIINSGSLVSDDIVKKLVENFISNKKYKNRLIFDGYPRNLTQAKTLIELLSQDKQKLI